MINRITALLLFIGLAFWGCEEAEEPDTTPPTITITSPQDGSIVSDSIEITCMSTDNEGVAMVELWVNGVSTGVTDSTEPYSLKWITSGIEHGTYTIVVRAYDINDNVMDSNPILLTVSNLSDYHLFNGTFIDEFDDDATSIVFISDSDGSILADTSFTGNTSVSLNADKTLDPPPDKINVTIVSRISGEIQIATNIGINRGSDWTWYGPSNEVEVIGESYYTFTNIPDDIYRVILTTKGNNNRPYINDIDTYSLSHYENNEDVLVMGLMNDGTALYEVIENVSVSETHELDFSNFLQAEQRIINNLTGKECDWVSHAGLQSEDSFVYYNRYRLSDGDDEGIAWTSDQNFITNYPPNFSKFLLGLTVGQWNAPGEKSWYQKTHGEMQESVRLIDGDINVISSDIDNFVMEISGSEPDQWGMELKDLSSDLEWNIYVDLNTTSGSIPYLPSSVTEAYPEINRASFVMTQVDLIDFFCAENQEEWHLLYFNTNSYYGDYCSGKREVSYFLE